MSRIIQRIQSYLATPLVANERIDDLLIELRGRGLNFHIKPINEDGQKYFYAESIGYHRGYISATGRTIAELEMQLKDAIFTSFEVPVRYCNPNFIVFNPPISKSKTVPVKAKVYTTT